jgi:Xaa-Pro aminopeptidase
MTDRPSVSSDARRLEESPPAGALHTGAEMLELSQLRAERLSRLQASMGANNVAACLFFHPANIRYATGTSVMDIFCTGSSIRYCVVPAEGRPILFEWEMAIPYSSQIVEDVRIAGWWQFTGRRRAAKADSMAEEIRDVLRELGAANEEIGVDRVDALALLALQKAHINVIDSSPITDTAREIKTPEEVMLLRLNCAIGDEMMADFEAAIMPGVTEYDLFATLSDSLLRRRGEVVYTRLISSGPNTNPWGSEASNRRVGLGDLVAVDTDANGYEGYVIDFSRTFLCGDKATPEQIEAYRVAHDSVTAMRESLRPGLSYDEFARIPPAIPEKYVAQRYDLMVHGAGLEDEGPIIYYPDQGDNSQDEYLQENMVLCLECYTGAVGGTCGVKLENQVLVTKSGAELLSRYPYDNRLLPA